MVLYLVKRIPQILLLLLAISTLLFFMLRLTGDPVILLLGPEASYEEQEAARHALSLDKPLPVQYVRFLSQLAEFEFGRSIWTGQRAIEMVFARVPATIYLAATSVLIAIVCGLPIGIFSALHREHPSSSLMMLLALIGQSVPAFWLGLMLILIFAVGLNWLPAVGYGSWRHLLLPVITLAGLPMARIARIARSAMLDVVSEPYIRTARSKGLSENSIIVHHALKNMLIPVVTVIGIDLGQLMGGAVVVESIFAWPGVGRQLYLAALGRDYSVIQATVFVSAATVAIINLAVDAIYFKLDPRLEY